jgi:thiol-disulfide isomerase/thioredoxin
MLFTSILISGFRVRVPVGQSVNAPFIPGIALDSILKNRKRSVVFFHEPNANLDFANFGIQQYKGEFEFLRANASEGEKYGCYYFPCAICFEKNKPLNAPIPTNRASSFLIWLQEIVEKSANKIKSQEQLRLLLERQGKVVIGIDENKPPKKLGDLEFYTCASSFFQKIGINLTKGYYLYRSVDRQLIPYGEKAKETLLVDPRIVDISSKPYFGGYVINTKLDKVSEEQIKIMEQLAPKYGEKVQFGPIVGVNALLFLKAGKTEGLDAPYFMMFNTSNLFEGRWLVMDMNDLMSVEKIDQFVEKVVSGNLPYTIISEPVPEDADGIVKHLVGSTFSDVVLENESDALVVFMAPNCKYCPRLEIALEEVAKLFEGQNVKICKIDGSENDVPNIVPEYTSYPTIMFFKAGKKKEPPMIYKGSYRVKDIVQYIERSGETNPKAPEYDAEAIDDIISEKYKKLTEEPNEEEQKAQPEL